MGSFPDKSLAKRIFSALTAQMSDDLDQISRGSGQLSLPIIDAEDIKSLCAMSREYFEREPTLVDIYSPVVIFGDLHGHFLDLLRILRQFGQPTNRKFLFLGDLVDRGEFSLETVTTVFALKVLYPENVYVIKGNHECGSICSRCGFFAEVTNTYGNPEIYDSFLQAFAELPLAARIDKSFMCVHGGIGPSLKSVSQLQAITRPLDTFTDNEIVESLLWSDPRESTDGFEASSRGSGFFFGKKSLFEFLNRNGIKVLIRGHEVCPCGVNYMFDNRLITVFGASNYCGLVSNSAAALIIENMATRSVAFPPFPYIKRENAVFSKPEAAASLQEISGTTISSSCSSLNIPRIVRPENPITPTSRKLETVRKIKKCRADSSFSSLRLRTPLPFEQRRSILSQNHGAAAL